MNKRDFEGNSVLITGAGNGIGRAVAKLIHERGAKILALDKDQTSLDLLKTDLQDIEVFCVDITDWNATTQCLLSLPVVDFLVNNAGVVIYNPIQSIDEMTIDSMMSGNVKGMLNVTKSIFSKMRLENRPGAIVNVASRTGLHGIPNLGAYSASKAAVIQLTRVMAIEFGPHQIRVNAVCPGLVDTAMLTNYRMRVGPQEELDVIKRTPLGRICQPKDVAEVIIFLLSDASAMVSGAIIPVDGGMSAW